MTCKTSGAAAVRRKAQNVPLLGSPTPLACRSAYRLILRREEPSKHTTEQSHPAQDPMLLKESRGILLFEANSDSQIGLSENVLFCC